MLRPGKAVAFILGLMLTQVAAASEYKPGEVIVKYKEGVFRSRHSMNLLYDTVGVEGIEHYNGLIRGFEHLILDKDTDVQKVIEELQKDEKVEYAQPNYILYVLPIIEGDNQIKNSRRLLGIPCIIPGIPYPPGCEDESTPDSKRPDLKDAPPEVDPPKADPMLEKAYGLKKISALDAWKINQGSRKIIVADIDTGIDYNHDDLSANIWRNSNPGRGNDIVGYDFIHNDGLPYDDNGHGTHTAGTIGAVGGNGIGIAGVSPRVSLMALKFLSGDGSGTTADAIRAIDYAIEHGAKVLSNSWGGRADPDNQALYDVIERANKKGVLFIAAAGNDGENNDGAGASHPAAFNNENLIAVAATDENDRLASFSNFGKKSTHLAAPGVRVYSTIPGNRYKANSGTSMACPHVAGAAALVWSAHPEWSSKQVKQALLGSVDALPELKGKTVTGGRLNVLKALQFGETDSGDQDQSGQSRLF